MPEFSRLADKFAVRAYVQEKLGNDPLITLYKSTRHVTRETFEDLPNQFVMKSTHGAGQVYIVRDKNAEDLDALAKQANAWLTVPYNRFEKHYKKITPRILFERLLSQKNGQPPADYKVHVFNNGSHNYCFVQVIDGRFGETTQNLFSETWGKVPFDHDSRLPKSDAPEILEPPKALDDMIQKAKTLAGPFGYCRVDFYCFEGAIYFGEMTFTPGAGNLRFISPYWDTVLGSYFAWPDEPEFGTPLTSSYRFSRRLKHMTGLLHQRTN
ncbi:ATP-grasp fold amidoligase family protein [Larsenimonas suaedae]|uniref:ATP-grasp fold amidoligase family protein n=1 Tax=Larsenimonas suaedae TaxID=1851019 RepID=A0ABU1GTT0_9GAMM|nr:ATP-grasp fold amidoligase family protein [Larsenimonas suaedae]MCM2972396.1 hypothetical protein [Larsenimonas suaedae]MDR5894808.1 ATP-grasp fold amidoligase family protein [Larsenimonas suaedae]